MDRRGNEEEFRERGVYRRSERSVLPEDRLQYSLAPNSIHMPDRTVPANGV